MVGYRLEIIVASVSEPHTSVFIYIYVYSYSYIYIYMSYVVPYILDAASYCTRNGSCVGSNIGIGSWSVSIPIQG